MNPQSFEKYVAGIYEKEGYDVTVTPYSGDYGVDVIAEKGGERIAVQVKQYGGSARKVNRQAVAVAGHTLKTIQYLSTSYPQILAGKSVWKSVT